MRHLLATNLLSRWIPSDFGDFASLCMESVLCLGTAVLCGLVIGAEREKKQKPAGLRTHILVGLGSAAFVHIGAVAHAVGGLGTVSDFNRLIQSVAMGIGFLGAGAIFRAREEVRGVTTAASIWVMGAIGAAAGAGALLFAFLLTGFAYVVLRRLRMRDSSPDESA